MKLYEIFQDYQHSVNDEARRHLSNLLKKVNQRKI